ncbi:MAG: EscU/YscU/HrcU family type III secretion system export apparatus switch protein [Myxococcaceae bacterium]|nr:EscU/YscU/HrcU family type III secretion system export apparatus switch protein [Myxococcaceae bacterium]
MANDDEPIAIAVKYDKEKDNAPRVVAKGMRLRAEKLKEIAKEYNIPLMRNVALANALFRVEVGEEIPEELYDAVAEVLNFVFALKQEQEGQGKK